MYVGSQGNQNKQTNNYSYIDDCLTKSVNFEIFNFGADFILGPQQKYPHFGEMKYHLA